ncbi:hypothetical protein LDO32_16715 [Luteimonas sp. Y-2-2-4F]|nr:hypothetical protein [Luteimonas sp. Y-2-2-4F]MCD9033359.1 hypothetical protein [Luteimonas sp. Y-2-2-4F]
MDSDDQLSNDFLSAMGFEFSSHVSLPIPDGEINPHECCEVVWRVLGHCVTPNDLAGLSELKLAALAQEFGNYFECAPPSISQVKAAVDSTLFRWPANESNSGVRFTFPFEVNEPDS